MTTFRIILYVLVSLLSLFPLGLGTWVIVQVIRENGWRDMDSLTRVLVIGGILLGIVIIMSIVYTGINRL